MKIDFIAEAKSFAVRNNGKIIFFCPNNCTVQVGRDEFTFYKNGEVRKN